MSNCTIRPATLEDYEDVMKIGIMYDGVDYLPSVYEDFLNDEAYKSFVCEVDGEIIGFRCVFRRDDDTTAQLRAGRIKASHRGQGYFKALGRWISTFVSQNTSTTSMVSVRSGSTINWSSLEDPVTVIDTFVICVGYIPWPRISSYILSQAVYRLTKIDMMSIFQHPEICQELFPQGLIYNLQVALSLQESNIKYLVNNMTCVLATTSKVSTGATELSAGMLTRDTTLLTVGTSFPAPAGHCYSIHVFGKDCSSVKDHVQAHLNLVQSASQNLWLRIGSKDDIVDAFLEVFSFIGMRESKQERFYTFRNPVDGNA